MLLLLLYFPNVGRLAVPESLFSFTVGFNEGFDSADLGVEVVHDLVFAFLPVFFPGF